MTITLPQDWKTSAAGPLTAYLATQPNPRAAEISGALTVAGVIARAWLGLIMKDAGTVAAMVPGDPTPTIVPSHEIPDDPKAVPITDAANFPSKPTK